MRLSGQGLMSHTATTTIARFFEKSRGRALSITWLGLSVAEFISPLLIVFLLAFILIFSVTMTSKKKYIVTIDIGGTKTNLGFFLEKHIIFAIN
jgi:hypothetical protein